MSYMSFYVFSIMIKLTLTPIYRSFHAKSTWKNDDHHGTDLYET